LFKILGDFFGEDEISVYRNYLRNSTKLKAPQTNVETFAEKYLACLYGSDDERQAPTYFNYCTGLADLELATKTCILVFLVNSPGGEPRRVYDQRATEYFYGSFKFVRTLYLVLEKKTRMIHLVRDNNAINLAFASVSSEQDRFAQKRSNLNRDAGGCYFEAFS